MVTDYVVQQQRGFVQTLENTVHETLKRKRKVEGFSNGLLEKKAYFNAIPTNLLYFQNVFDTLLL